MKPLRILVSIVLVAIFQSGCVTGNIKKVEDPNIQITRPGYSVVPPGANWAYVEEEQPGKYTLILLGLRENNADTFAAIIDETYSGVTFNNHEEFLSIMSKDINEMMDPERYSTLDEKIESDDKFGPYCIKFYAKFEYHALASNKDEPQLILVVYGYIFKHPWIEDLWVGITYSERGRADEIDPNIKDEAQRYFDGFTIRQRPNTGDHTFTLNQ